MATIHGTQKNMIYNSIPATVSSRREGHFVGRRHTRRMALSAAACAVLALVGMATLGTNTGRSVLYYHGILDPVTWDGVGAGGIGATYHWTAHSFSPISGTKDMHFTHDHSSLGNSYNEDGWTRVETPVEDRGSPVRKSRPYGWLDRMSDTALDDANMTNSTEGMMWHGIPLKGYDFFGRIFPKVKGYSRNLFGGDDLDKCCNCSDSTISCDEDNSTGTANATGGDADATKATDFMEGDEEKEEQEWQKEGKEWEEAFVNRGVNSPMVFNDMPQIAGYEPVQRSPMFRADEYAQQW